MTAHPAMAASNIRYASADLLRINGAGTTSGSWRLPIVGALMMAGLMLLGWPIGRRKRRLMGAALLVIVLAMS